MLEPHSSSIIGSQMMKQNIHLFSLLLRKEDVLGYNESLPFIWRFVGRAGFLSFVLFSFFLSFVFLLLLRIRTFQLPVFSPVPTGPAFRCSFTEWLLLPNSRHLLTPAYTHAQREEAQGDISQVLRTHCESLLNTKNLLSHVSFHQLPHKVT